MRTFEFAALRVSKGAENKQKCIFLLMHKTNYNRKPFA